MTMKKTTCIFVIAAICAFFPSCASTKSALTSLGNGITSLANNKTLAVDAGIALDVATQYEKIAKVRKVTLADFVIIAQSAVAQYAAAQAVPPTPATIDNWVDVATKAVVVYDTSKGVNATSAP